MKKRGKKRKLKKIISDEIRIIAKKLKKYPYYFANEDTIRAELYHKISTHFKHKIMLIPLKKRCNAIQSDAIILNSKKTIKPDLLIYYTNNKVPVQSIQGKVHFFAKTKQSKEKYKENIGKRILIEIKISKSEKRGKKGIYNKLLKDFNKLKIIDFSVAYLVFVDRGSKIDKEIRRQIKSFKKKDKRFIVYYIGCSGTKKSLHV